ncbi:PhoH-like phosphate starvation-inducible [Vibrio phage K469]
MGTGKHEGNLRKGDRRRLQEAENDQFEKFDKGQFKFEPFIPKTDNQGELFDQCVIANMVVAVGPAGTGKSICEAAAAAKLIGSKAIDQIILTRNPLPTGRSTGFNPGTAEEKLLPWLAPIMSNLKKVMKTDKGNDGFFKYMMEKRAIKMLELESVKGSSFDDAFIIVEECQEMEMESLKNLSTRTGENTTIVLNGDMAQGNSKLRTGDFERFVDSIKKNNANIRRKIDNGERLEDWEQFIPVIEFTKEDCCRSGLCRQMLEIFEEYDL